MRGRRSPLAGLLRLHGWRIDEQRRAVAEANLRLEELERALVALATQIAGEQACVRQAVDGTGFGYGPYAVQARKERERLQQVRAEAGAALAEARKNLADAYRERRKFEVVKANRDREVARKQTRREQARLDEIGARRGAESGTSFKS